MYGVVTRKEGDVTEPAFDLVCYEVKDVTGRRTKPVAGAINMVSCFGDSATAATTPDLVPVSDTGAVATRDQPYFDWSYICPSHENYQEDLLVLIEECAGVHPDVRLDDVGFPRGEYCHCSTCQERFAAAETDDWYEWRSTLITDFVRAAVTRIPGRTYLTLYPDPYPGHLYHRAGLDTSALSELVDQFVIPLYDMTYSTTYWLEILATGFVDLLGQPPTIELYAVHIEPENLHKAATVASAYADHVLFAYDTTAATDTIQSLQ